MEVRMRKTLAVAILVAVAIMAVAVASASAAALVGTCHVEGNAEFGGKALPFGVPKNLPYSFTNGVVEKGEPVNKPGFPVGGTGVECEEAATPKEKFKGVATVTGGRGLLACGASGSLEVNEEIKAGDVDLKLSKKGTEPWEKQYDLDLQLAAVGGTVVLTVGRSPEGVVLPEATGEANFVEPGNVAHKAERAAECVAGTLKNLPFYATLVGTLEEGS
jgi:hypothetical protein